MSSMSLTLVAKTGLGLLRNLAACCWKTWLTAQSADTRSSWIIVRIGREQRLVLQHPDVEREDLGRLLAHLALGTVGDLL